MVEAGLGQFAGQLLADPDPRGDEVGVEPALRSVAGEFDDVAPRRRLAAGEMDMQRPERGGLAEHPLPGFRIEFRAGALERQRI